MNLKLKIAMFCDIDSTMISSFVLDDEDIVFFTVLNKDRFSIYLDEHGEIIPTTLKFLGTHPPLEEPPF